MGPLRLLALEKEPHRAAGSSHTIVPWCSCVKTKCPRFLVRTLRCLSRNLSLNSNAI